MAAALAAPAAFAAPAISVPAFAPTLVPPPPADVGVAEVIHVAQSREEAQLILRIQALEDQIRVLTGQVEGLQFQVTQMQTMIEKQNEDNEFRFQQLEGGAPAAPPASDSGAALPAQAAPQSATQDVTGSIGGVDNPIPQAHEMPMDGLGESLDPLVGKGGGEAELGALPDGDSASLGEGRPLDLTLDNGTPVNGDARAQFAAGYDAIVRGDYAFAEEQFRQFIALYPDDPQAPDATNWLGEALIQRGAYDEAADVLLTGFQDYPNSERAPEILLRLGVALAGAGETDTACRTFAEVQKRYPRMSSAFSGRLEAERARAQCHA